MDIRQWFITERGITEETLDKFEVITEGGKAELPYIQGGAKTRVMMDDGSRKFFFTPGVTPGLYYRPYTTEQPDAAFIVEGETDTMRLQQEVGNGADVYGLSGIEGWEPKLASHFDKYKRVFVILDNDEDYNVIGRVESAYQVIRRDVGPRVVRLRLPRGTKDICEFFKFYDLDALHLLVEQAPAMQYHYEALDLTQDPPEIDWLVNQMIAQGDVAMMVGEPSVGKSWIAMDLAVAVANGNRQWLGHSVLKQGRVLYIDEENPRILVHKRMDQLGLTKEGAMNVRYLHQQDIRLDNKPERLFDEIQAFDPTLIVVDSLTRVHTKDENNAGEMAKLFNDGLNPMSRMTGAVTLVLHHVNKSDATSGFGRVRGSSDIPASIDAGFDVRKTNADRLNVVQFKSRWRASGQTVTIELVTSPQDTVEVKMVDHPNVF